MALLQSLQKGKIVKMAYFGARVNKTNNKKHSKNNSRTKLDLVHVKKAAGKNKQYSENDKIWKTRKRAILQKAIA